MNIKKLARKNILDLAPYSSARNKYLSVILLDANENSFGSVFEDSEVSDLNRYPDPNHFQLKNKAAKVFSVEKNNLFFGVGSDEIIDLLIRAFGRPAKDSAVIAEPTYGMYKVCCDINEIKVIKAELTASFQIDIEKMLKAIEPDTKFIFLCSPNNPTGNKLDREDIIRLLNEFAGLIILDEAYIDFSEDNSLINEITRFPNLVVLRTFSKAWGMAGVRCGFCAADEEVVNLLMKIKSPYNLSKLTINAVLKALSNFEKRDNFIREIKSEKIRLTRELENLEKIEKVFASDANFILFKCAYAKETYTKLAMKGIIIRDRSSQVNLENCLRVTIGTKTENDKFLNALKEVL